MRVEMKLKLKMKMKEMKMKMNESENWMNGNEWYENLRLKSFKDISTLINTVK